MAKNTPTISASGQAVTGRGAVGGVLVPTHNSGTIKLIDSPNGPSGRVILDTFTFATGSQVVPLPDLEYYEGVYVIIGGAASIQLAFNPT